MHLVESVEKYALCMRRCLLCSSKMSVTHSALAFTRANRTDAAPSIKLCAIGSYRLFHSRAQVVSFTDSMMWTGVGPICRSHITQYCCGYCKSQYRWGYYEGRYPDATVTKGWEATTHAVASEHPHYTLNGTATCSSHSSTAYNMRPT